MDWRGDLGEDMMAAASVGGGLVAEAWARVAQSYRIGCTAIGMLFMSEKIGKNQERATLTCLRKCAWSPHAISQPSARRE